MNAPGRISGTGAPRGFIILPLGSGVGTLYDSITELLDALNTNDHQITKLDKIGTDQPLVFEAYLKSDQTSPRDPSYFPEEIPIVIIMTDEDLAVGSLPATQAAYYGGIETDLSQALTDAEFLWEQVGVMKLKHIYLPAATQLGNNTLAQCRFRYTGDFQWTPPKNEEVKQYFQSPESANEQKGMFCYIALYWYPEVHATDTAYVAVARWSMWYSQVNKSRLGLAGGL